MYLHLSSSFNEINEWEFKIFNHFLRNVSLKLKVNHEGCYYVVNNLN